MIWVEGVTEGGSFGQLCVDEPAAEAFCDALDRASRLPIRWRLVEVAATESREAHAEAQARLRESEN